MPFAIILRLEKLKKLLTFLSPQMRVLRVLISEESPLRICSVNLRFWLIHPPSSFSRLDDSITSWPVFNLISIFVLACFNLSLAFYCCWVLIDEMPCILIFLGTVLLLFLIYLQHSYLKNCSCNHPQNSTKIHHIDCNLSWTVVQLGI